MQDAVPRLSKPLRFVLLVGLCACGERDPASLDVARAPVDPVVFDDDYGVDVYFQPFSDSRFTAVELDALYAHGGFAADGARSLKISVPAPASAMGSYAGGVLACSDARDFADFNALTFFARSEVGCTLDLVGFGDDNTGTAIHEVFVQDLEIGPEWKAYFVPIPDPSRLVAERGLFLFAETAEAGQAEGYAIWFDDIRFDRIERLEHLGSQLPSSRRYYFTGTSAFVGMARSVFLMAGQYHVVDHGPSYFDFVVTDADVARVDRTGRIRVGRTGDSSITARLGGVDAVGKIMVTAYDPPVDPAPRPTLPASQVISLFSDVYSNVPVDTWRQAEHGVTTVLGEYAVSGDPVKMYAMFDRTGIDFRNPPVDASSMKFLHLDVYAPAGSDFEVTIISYAEDLSDFAEAAPVIYDLESDPPYLSGRWMSLEISLTNLVLPATWEWSRVGHIRLASNDAKLVLVDNVYFHE